MTTDAMMISGVLYAPAGGADVGFNFRRAFAGARYPAMLQSMGRYLALGLIALPLAWLRARATAPVEPARLVDRAGPRQ